MAKKKITYARLMELAKDYQVADNSLFQSAAQRYMRQMDIIAKMEQQIAEDGPTTAKEYVKGRENLCAHPLISELPKHYSAANQTLGVMLDIVKGLGSTVPEEDKLDDFMKDDD